MQEEILVSKEKRNQPFWEREKENISSRIIESPPIIISKLGFLSIILTLTLTIRSDFQVWISLSIIAFLFFSPIVLGLSFVPKSFFFCFKCKYSVSMFALKLFLLCLLCLVLSLAHLLCVCHSCLI